MSISRRLFLTKSAAAGAATVIAPAAVVHAAKPEMTARELAIWHMEELQRLVIADGASEATVIVCGHDYGGTAGIAKAIALHPTRLVDSGGMFAAKGGTK